MVTVTGCDIETTGLDQEKGHRIIEVAFLTYDASSKELLSKYVQRINPQRSIDIAAQRVHGISVADLASEPLWEDVAPKISDILKDSDYIVAHNGDGFDLPFIVKELLRVGLEVPEVEGTFDTMLKGRWATFDGKNPNLGELCFACGVDYQPDLAHAADYDVEVMMQCLWFGMESGFFRLDT